MKNKKQHIDQNFDGEELSNMKVNYTKSKEDIWAQMESKLNTNTSKKDAVVIKFNFKRWSLAASLVLIVGALAFMKFFTERIVSNQFETIVVTLPDNSKVTLRGGSEISYAPYWWFANRSIEFEGEAFFEVEKGSSFTVNSNNGMTQVLGTSFNIYARNNSYEVYCRTGKVKVTTEGDNKVITPGMFIERIENGKLAVSNDAEEIQFLDWRTKQFIFTNASLDKVMLEIEREYNVSIAFADLNASNLFFSGKLDRDKSVNDLLTMIAFSLDLQLEQVNKSSFVLKE